MNRETEEMLTALLDGQLTAEQEQELRARLASDADLRELWEQLQSQRQLLRGLPRVKAPEDFLGKVAVALQEHSRVVTLPSSEIEERGPRGGWRAVIGLASALAAVLLLGVFLWPRSVATNSDRVASFDGNDRVRQQQVEELKRLKKGDWTDSAPTQRAPAGALPKATELADGNTEMPPAGDSLNTTGVPDAAPPGARMGENLQAQVAPADELPIKENQRSVRRDAEAVDSAGKQAAEIAGIPQKMWEMKAANQPSLAAPSPNAGPLGALASNSGPIEVWVVDAPPKTEPAASQDKQLAESQVEVYFASVAEANMPGWLNELQSSAAITQLDTNESRELIGQLARQMQLREKPAEGQPSAAAAAVQDDPAGYQSGAGSAEASGKSEESIARVGYLGMQEAAPYDDLLSRSQQRQLAGQKSAEQQAGIAGLGGGGGAAAAGAGAGGRAASGSENQAKPPLESQLSDLRKRSVSSLPVPQPVPTVGGRNVLLIIRSR